MYEERFYRYFLKNEFSLEISYQESDLYIISSEPLNKEFVQNILKNYYSQIENYIKEHPSFLSALSSLPFDENAPFIIQDMLKASKLSGLGPFSAVAGAVAFYVGKELLKYSQEVIIENGGDIFLNIKEDKKIGLYCGKYFDWPFLTLKIRKRNYSFGICTSSSKIGHSINFGEADAVMVLAKDVLIADTFATLYSNMLKKEKDIQKVCERAKKNSIIEAVVVAFKGKLFFWGDIELDGKQEESS